MESINNEILTLNQTKDLLENTKTKLKKDSSEMAFEAEKHSKLELLSKLNALKRAATKKQVELDAGLTETKGLIERKWQLRFTFRFYLTETFALSLIFKTILRFFCE